MVDILNELGVTKIAARRVRSIDLYDFLEMMGTLASDASVVSRTLGN